ncbi:MAG: hypothetical protein CFE33_18830 [Pseudorhodobacter sp. PARRP1]|nr:MAG: hypothetical protein CFE33_18830 [Pseudorhodobacter sp. PARRP1]
MEQLFLRYLKCSPRRHYLDLQLGLAWQLGERTDMLLFGVALASGFSSHSLLSRKFERQFSISPSELRPTGRRSSTPLHIA